MSTRAHIRIIEGDGQILLYHHCDGYPEGVGSELKQFLKKYKYGWYAESIAKGLVTMKNEWNDFPYEPAICLHGDEEYIYVIECDKQELTCYSHKWDEPIEKSCVPERVCEIPDPEED